MNLVEISALFQSGVLSGIALLLCWRAPAIWTAVLDYLERTRTFEAEQSSLERDSRHELATKTAVALSELTVAINELKVASRDICRHIP